MTRPSVRGFGKKLDDNIKVSENDTHKAVDARDCSESNVCFHAVFFAGGNSRDSWDHKSSKPLKNFLYLSIYVSLSITSSWFYTCKMQMDVVLKSSLNVAKYGQVYTAAMEDFSIHCNLTFRTIHSFNLNCTHTPHILQKVWTTDAGMTYWHSFLVFGKIQLLMRRLTNVKQHFISIKNQSFIISEMCV